MNLVPKLCIAALFATSCLMAQPPPTAVAGNEAGKAINGAQFTADGKHLITTSSNVVQIWDAREGKPLSVALPHMGTWQLSSMKYGDDAKWSEVPPGQKRLKLITDTHFTWVAYESSTGKLTSMAGGKYTLTGNSYTETIEYAGEGMGDYLHKPHAFTIRVDGDKLHQSGQLSDGTKIEEVWQRVK